MTTQITAQVTASEAFDKQIHRAYCAARGAWLETLILLHTSDNADQWRQVEQDAWHVVEHFRNILKVDK